MSPSIQVLKLIEGMCSCSNNGMKMFELDPFSHKPRPIWRSSDQAPGEVSGLDGAPQSQTSWLCIQTQIWRLLKEVYEGPWSLHKLTFQIKMLTLSSSSPGPLTYELFATSYRYKPLCPATWPHWRGVPADGVEVLAQHLGYLPNEYKMGRWGQSFVNTARQTQAKSNQKHSYYFLLLQHQNIHTSSQDTLRHRRCFWKM